MYRKIRCDVRQWKILRTFRGTKHNTFGCNRVHTHGLPQIPSLGTQIPFHPPLHRIELTELISLVITTNRAPRAFYWWWAVFCFCLHACMFTTDPLKLITSSRSGNHALNIVCLFLFERQIGYRGAVSHCHGCREHAALLSLLNLLVAALRCAIAFWVN